MKVSWFALTPIPLMIGLIAWCAADGEWTAVLGWLLALMHQVTYLPPWRDERMRGCRD